MVLKNGSVLPSGSRSSSCFSPSIFCVFLLCSSIIFKNRHQSKIIITIKTNEIEFEKIEGIEEDQERYEDIELEAKFVAKKIKELIETNYQVYDRKKETFRNK